MSGHVRIIVYHVVVSCLLSICVFFFFQAEDGIRDLTVTGVQTCALPISRKRLVRRAGRGVDEADRRPARDLREIGRASCRERGEISGGAVSLKKKKKKQV